MNRNYEEVFQTVEQIVHQYNAIENRKRTYGLDFELTCTEIHVIHEIGRCPGIGIRSIAKNKGVTEGAVSQLVKRLIGKGLICKQISEESEAKVNLTLTNDGMICYQEHEQYHKTENEKWYSLLDQINDDDYQKEIELLHQIKKIMEVAQ